MNIKFKDIIVVGFALFAMFFGAGNLIFPPYLGVLSGPQWFIAFITFLFADGGLALLGVIALTKVDGNMDALFSRAGKTIGVAIGIAMILCIGPFVAIPRTAATTYEIGILPTVGSGFNPILFSIIFFVIVLVLTIKPSKVIDIVGAVLTPTLLVCLAILIVKGVVQPLGQIQDKVLIEGVAARGISEGYQTMDAMAACIFAGIVINSIKAKGYKDASMIKATIYAGFVAVVGLAFVYGGLAYLGATVNTQFGLDAERTKLIVSITEQILGGPGKIILAIIVALACLTTAIGLSSACGNYFEEISKGKLKYAHVVIVVCIFSAIISNFGVDQIINIAFPILLAIYPAVIVYIILGLFNNKIHNDNLFVFGVWSALVIGIISSIAGLKMFEGASWANSINGVFAALPGAKIGFYWIVPVAIFILIGKFIPSKKNHVA
ncbi:branched-chain amino acid transport system II carrier protein [Peptostreptococcus equinus]|uniref:Branched-chain amino acid transport system carrier protein n=1 Tax=Peptostreptococcus equinus TaxID=3003601 RepID=A0ABY7JUW6_9FIRM|nr:branched-chain amino acid transport system II carrier protein [Peptostreptococcus sp. CBA3647]WAW15692.1 branched-chain amino acid transport system II carrier protein [Peptostreptococcus sp. CBA3647]